MSKPQLNKLLNHQFVQIGAMQTHELVSAIARPALHVGLRIDPELVAKIINDMEGEPGSLPLMQFAMVDLYDTQKEKMGTTNLHWMTILDAAGFTKHWNATHPGPLTSSVQMRRNWHGPSLKG